MQRCFCSLIHNDQHISMDPRTLYHSLTPGVYGEARLTVRARLIFVHFERHKLGEDSPEPTTHRIPSQRSLVERPIEPFLWHFSCLTCDLEHSRRDVEAPSGQSMATSSNQACSNIRFGALVTTSIWGCAYRLIHPTAYPDVFYLVFLSCELSFYHRPWGAFICKRVVLQCRSVRVGWLIRKT